MASSKDQAVARPNSGNFSRMPSSNRSHSNSLSLSATNTNHRVHRRKSNAQASSTAQAAIAAALRETGEATSIPLSSHRRSIGSRKNIESQSMNARPSIHTYFGPGAVQSVEQDTFEDMSMDEEADTADKTFVKNRNRRASEGSHLIKGASKKGDLKCDACGKSYKHSSCLTKHMWEHDPAWAITSKLLISKHQQVQLLEAASALCNMNADPNADMHDLDVTHNEQSEESSDSPAYSGSSEMQDDASSVETTPPPMSDGLYTIHHTKRDSAGSAAFSRSYRSAVSSSFADSVVSPALMAQGLSAVDLRPTTSGTEDGKLAAATAGLTFGSIPKPRSSIADTVPPVPPLPQRYQSYSKSANLSEPHDPFSFHPPILTQELSEERGYRESVEDRIAQRKSQVEEEGIFRMD